MRIARLELTRYGKFTGKEIDFGSRIDGQPDLHIMFGSNEAGKTTALSAYLDLLFGIEVHGQKKRSRYSFIHPEATMRVAATLELDGGARTFIRIRRPQNTLLGADEQPIADGVLSGELGGLDRAAYRAMFSLDDETIESGGDSILQSKGDLGQLLFSASAGLADLSGQLELIRDEANRFYKYRARSGELQDLKNELARLKDERGRIDTLASHYAQLMSARDSAKGLYDSAVKENARIRARLDETGRMLGALPRLVMLRDLRNKLAALDGLPVAPLGAADELKELQREDVDLAARLEGAQAEIERLGSVRDGDQPDEAAAAMIPLLDSLGILRARHIAADEDLPKRQQELGDIEHAIKGILDRLALSHEGNPARLILKAATVGRLRTLIEQRPALLARRETAEGEVETAQQRLSAAIEKHQSAGGVDESVDHAGRMVALGAMASAFRNGEALVARAAAKVEVEAAEADLGEKLRLLSPWTGSADDLANASAPDKSAVARWKGEISVAQKQRERSAADIERLEKEIGRLNAEISELGRSTGLIDDSDAASIRVARDHAWRAHRASLDPATADAFEALMRRDDDAMAARFSHSSELARLRQAGVARATMRADLEQARGALSEANISLSELHLELIGAFGFLNLKTPDEHAITQVETWLRLCDEAIKGRTRLSNAQRAMTAADEAIEKARTRLLKALDAIGLSQKADAAIEDLADAAFAAVAEDQQRATLREAIEQRRRDLAERELALRAARDAEAKWSEAWTSVCKSCWLGEADASPAVDDVREVLECVAKLDPMLEKRRGLVDRIDKMAKDQTEFAAEIARHATALGLDAVENVLVSHAAIESRISSARTAAAMRKKGIADLEAAEEKHRELAARQALHEKRKAAVFDALKVASLEAAAETVTNIKSRDELREQTDGVISEICQTLSVQSIEDAESALDDLDRSLLEQERAELTSRHDAQTERLHGLYAEFSKAEDRIEAVGGDDAVARLEEQRKTALLQIEDGAQRYLRLRLGAAAAEQALRIYRDKHRSTMMARASDAFRTISRGAYRSLVAQPGNDGDILVAIGADGGSKVAPELSKGARFQLYLALRIAGYHEFVATRRPVPFIADDIMETFDDDRSAEAIGLFGEIAQLGQVIYMTHHRHLCDLARKVCPSVKIHELA